MYDMLGRIKKGGNAMLTSDGQEITEKLLLERFPLLFADRYRSMQETAMCWGFEVGPGWLGILYNAAEKLEPLIRDYIAAHPENRNPFRWLGLFGPWGYFRHPKIFVLHMFRWLRGVIQPSSSKPWWPRALQIKEKYGTLRFYLTHGTDMMYTIIDATESQSRKICEECGAKGKLRGHSWLYVSCARHKRTED